MNEWETYTINVTHNDEKPAEYANKEHERMIVNERFETELYRLIKKYQGQAGLQFDARTSEGQPILEY